jgi:hypothetical protein
VQQRACDDQVDVRLSYGAGRVTRDARDLPHVQEEPAQLGVMSVHGAWRAFERDAEGVVGKKEVDRAPERCGAQFGAQLVDAIPDAFDVDVDALQKGERIELLDRQHAHRAGELKLALPRAVVAEDCHVTNDLHDASAVSACRPLQALRPDGGRLDRPRGVAEGQHNEWEAGARGAFGAIADEELVLHAVADAGGAQIVGGHGRKIGGCRSLQQVLCGGMALAPFESYAERYGE